MELNGIPLAETFDQTWPLEGSIPREEELRRRKREMGRQQEAGGKQGLKVWCGGQEQRLLAELADGDARSCLNILEMCWTAAVQQHDTVIADSKSSKGRGRESSSPVVIRLTVEDIRKACQGGRKSLLYDRNGPFLRPFHLFYSLFFLGWVV